MCLDGEDDKSVYMVVAKNIRNESCSGCIKMGHVHCRGWYRGYLGSHYGPC